MRRIEGFVIVSADGMLADSKGEMPASIRNDADQRFFQNALDHAAVIVHGRLSHEGGPHAARRKRLVLTRQVAALAPSPSLPHALLWNPVGATLEQAFEQLGVGVVNLPKEERAKFTLAVVGPAVMRRLNDAS